MQVAGAADLSAGFPFLCAESVVNSQGVGVCDSHLSFGAFLHRFHLTFGLDYQPPSLLFVHQQTFSNIYLRILCQ